MGEATGIAWTDHTFNPWWGCMKVSPGCANCYAEQWDRRRGNPAGAGPGGHWGPMSPRRFFKDSHWKEPERWNRSAVRDGVRRRVFCASMADVFEDRADLVAPRARLFRLIAATPGLDWLLLTKRPENLSRFLPWVAPITEDTPVSPAYANPQMFGARAMSPDAPWPNVWVGTTVEDQRRAMERIPVLALIPAAVRFLSMEPLLEAVTLAPYLFNTCSTCSGAGVVGADGTACVCARYGTRVGLERSRAIDWVIAGTESGDGKRPARATWFRQLRDQCRDAGVAFFLKQAELERGPGYPGTGGAGPGLITLGAGSQVKNREPNLAISPYLDGAQHLAFPTPRTA